MTILNSEVRSLKRAAIVLQRVHGVSISANTIERICLDVGQDLLEAEQQQWQDVLTGQVPVPEVAIVEFDGGRIRTRQEGRGPGVHLAGKGWNETKQAIFVSAASETFDVDPEPEPPPCFLDPQHVGERCIGGVWILGVGIGTRRRESGRLIRLRRQHVRSDRTRLGLHTHA